MPRVSRLVALFLSSFAGSAPMLAQGAVPVANTGRPPVPAAEWGKWETLGAGALSPDGKWVAYDFRRASGGGELRYRAVAAEAEKSVRSGSGPIFTATSHFLLYTIAPDTAAAGGRAAAAAVVVAAVVVRRALRPHRIGAKSGSWTCAAARRRCSRTFSRSS